MIVSQHTLRRIWRENEARAASVEKQTIQDLLKHILQIEESTNFRYKIAYEVYSISDKSWAKREIIGIYWNVKTAELVAAKAARASGKNYRAGKTHIMRVGNRWHRVNVEPYECVIGDIREAELSPLTKEFETELMQDPEQALQQEQFLNLLETQS